MKRSFNSIFCGPREAGRLLPAGFFLCFSLFALGPGGFVCFAIAGEPPLFPLRATAQSDSSGVYLNEIFDTRAPLPALRLCDSPAFGKTTVLNRGQVAALLHDAGSELTVSNLAGADTIRIARRARTFTEADALNLLTDTLQKEYVKDKGELELRPVRPWAEVSVPDEPLSLKILELPSAGVSAAFIARFEIRTAREGVGIWQMNVQARIWREIWTAHSAITRGETLAVADVARERRDVLPVRDPLAEFSRNDPALEFSETVPNGAPLLARMLKPRNVVRRGQLADGLLRDGALSITMKVEVLEDAAPGQIIRARNPVTRRDFTGKVIDPQTILITL